MHSDPIADLLTRIRNGARAGLVSVDCPHSHVKEGIVKLLGEEGLISSYEVTKELGMPALRIHLKYDSRRRPILRDIRRVSRPGLRVYRAASDLKPVRNGLGTQIVSTNKGLMTDRQARKMRLGGEVLCEVW
jgi:small subunit ribosomal protein S8